MDKRLILLVLLAAVSHKAHNQSAESFQSTAVDEETQLDIPDEDLEGSGAQAFSETSNVPIIEDTETTTAAYEGDKIQCGDNVCTCTHEKDGDIVKITVDCSSKDLTSLPIGIDLRVNKLLLQNNKLEEVPKEISEFKELEELNVNNNSIKGFAYGSIGELPKLRILRAANNRLLDFPQELKIGLDLRSLEELDLGKNDIRETLTADYFTNMKKIHTLTLPVTTQDLIRDLCHRLGTTLEKVCMNDCNVDVEECLNYSDDLNSLSKTLKSDIDNQELYNELTSDVLEAGAQESVGKNESESKQYDAEPGLSSSDNILQGYSAVKSLSNASKLSDVPLLNANNEQEEMQVTSDHTDKSLQIQEVTDTAHATTEATQYFVTVEATTPTVSLVVESSTVVSFAVDDGAKIDDLLRNAVNSADNVNLNTSVVQSSPGTVLESPEIVSKAKGDIVDSALPIDDNKDNEQHDTTDENQITVGAASSKPGGGINNSTIALIVAGMVVIVAGVTIKKNWTSIRNRFRPSQSPAAGATATNGTTPEEVPLQDKSIV